MSFEPTLIVRRLIVHRHQNVVYDERLHEGVNVLRGENSSGKSTILNAIFYGLGGDLSEWSEAALLCTDVTLEVDFSGRSATLRRQISDQSGQPMLIFGAEYEIASKAPLDEWKRYPYRRSETLESFSQALFRLLDLPEVASDDSGNLTMHQILRLLYADQLSPVESLFRFERFDPPALRDAIGRLLCGSYDAQIYENELQIRNLSRQFEAVTGELRSLFNVLGHADQGSSFEWIEARRQMLENERNEVVRLAEAEERQLFELGKSDELTLRAQEDAYRTVQEIQATLALAERERDALQFSIGDSAAYIASLEGKLAALDDADLAAEHIGDVRFSTCPACYAPMSEETGHISPPHACHLCKTPFDSDRSRTRIAALITEAGTQLKQSRLLQERRIERLEKAQARVSDLRADWTKASHILQQTQKLPSTSTQERIRTLSRRAGYLEKEIEHLATQERVVSLIRDLSQRKENLNSTITILRDRIDTSRISQKRRIGVAYTAIADQIMDLLRHDLRRQDSFENPKSVEFDFTSNRISVDGHSYFSASSRVVLKSSFFLGFLAAATVDEKFRHPRFAIIDTIEDKGMEPERSHNFQRQILRKSNEARCKHQIIYATAMIAPEMDTPEFTVGKASTRDKPTLSLAISPQ